MVRFVFFYFNFFPTTVISFRIFLLLQRLLHLLSVPILLSMAMQIRLNTFTFFPLKFCHSRFYYHFVVICFFSFLFKLNLLIFWRHFILSNYKRISFNFLFFYLYLFFSKRNRLLNISLLLILHDVFPFLLSSFWPVAKPLICDCQNIYFCLGPFIWSVDQSGNFDFVNNLVFPQVTL